MAVTLRQLEAFVAVAQQAHFGNAAEQLHISQPVVSQEVRRLERMVGADLFDRSTRTVHLTSFGAALLAEAQAVGAAVDNFVSRAHRLSVDRLRRLRIAATPSVVDQILPVILRRAETAIPDLVLEEVAVETGEIPDALRNRGCDLGLGRFVRPPSGYCEEVIRTEQVLVALGAGHPLATGATIDLAQLGELPLLLWPREQSPPYHDRLIEICVERGLDPLLLVSAPRVVGSRSYLIADGRAFGLVSESTASRLMTGIHALPLASPASIPMSVVWMERDPRPLVAEFLDLVRSVGAEGRVTGGDV